MRDCSTRRWLPSNGRNCAQTLAARRAAGELVGAGLALFVEKSGLGPFDQVKVGVDTDGKVEVVTGSASVGQGMETAIAQICADALGVDYRSIRVTHGQTDRIEYGMGAFASRVTVMTGEATRIAACAVKAKAIEVASELLQAPAAVLDVVDGEVVRTDTAAGPSIGLGAIARALSPGSNLRRGRPPGLSADGWFHTNHMNYPYGVHIAVTRVDRDTGAVAIERYLVAYDIGKAVNPMLIEGQIAGGCVQGIGGTLFEEFLYDARGEPLSVTLADYLMPTAREVPPIEVLICEDAPSPLNPMGMKGRRRRRRQCGRRGDRRGDRRRARRAQRRDRASGDAATAAAADPAGGQAPASPANRSCWTDRVTPGSQYASNRRSIDAFRREKNGWTSNFTARRHW